MALFVRIRRPDSSASAGTVVEVITSAPSIGGASEWMDVSAVDPAPGPGWTYDGQTFSQPVTIANRDAIASKVRTALANNQAYLAIPSPTNAQAIAQVGALTRQVDGVIRLLVGLFDSTQDS